jgi:hypothetical protein
MANEHLSDIISIMQSRPKPAAPQAAPAPAIEPQPTGAAQQQQESDLPPPPPKKKSRAGRKPLPDKNRRSEILIIRLTKAEKKRLWELAKKKHTTLSSFVRKVSIGEYEKD